MLCKIVLSPRCIALSLALSVGLRNYLLTLVSNLLTSSSLPITDVKYHLLKARPCVTCHKCTISRTSVAITLNAPTPSCCKFTLSSGVAAPAPFFSHNDKMVSDINKLKYLFNRTIYLFMRRYVGIFEGDFRESPCGFGRSRSPTSGSINSVSSFSPPEVGKGRGWRHSVRPPLSFRHCHRDRKSR